VFNELLLSPLLCSAKKAVVMKAKIAPLRSWVEKESPEWFGNATDQLEPLEEAINLLLLNKKALADKTVVRAVAPNLNFAQIQQLLRQYTPEEYEEPIPQAILNSFSSLKTSSSNNVMLSTSASFDLDITQLQFLELLDMKGIAFPRFIVPDILSTY